MSGLPGLYGLGEQQPSGASTGLGQGWAYHLPDALGSVRQLTNASGGVTLAKAYAPYGSLLSSVGSGSSVYAFTGEQYDSQTGLVYLRARYYAPGVGGFISRDIWPGDAGRPHSFNVWSYALSNPVAYTDPSGHDPWGSEGGVPCWNTQSENPIYRYCVLLRGGFLDVVHFKGAKLYADVYNDGSIWNFVKSNENNPEKAYRTFEWAFPPRKIGPITTPPNFGLSVRYMVAHLNEIADEGKLKGVALGIYLHSQYMFENLQFPSGSGFSNEDLPSDYLGFLAGLEGRDLEWIVNELGGGYASVASPMGYSPTGDQFRSCFWLGQCDVSNPMNVVWTLRILIDCDDGGVRFVNSPWPDSLTLDPVGPGRYWQRVAQTEGR